MGSNERAKLLLLWEKGCPSCRTAKPEVLKAAKALADLVTFESIDIGKVTLPYDSEVKAVPTLRLERPGCGPVMVTPDRFPRSGFTAEVVESWVRGQLAAATKGYCLRK